ncbi:MAG: ABC transporter substrate-binding protein [Desulfitobacterium sp.]|nr:ABC transporter substrate-binding protein [Desulfitobacterium sp.]
MKKNIFHWLIAILVSCMLLLAGCSQEGANVSQPENEVPEKTEVTITDSLGESITIPYPLERVVLLNSNIAEAIAILGVQDAVVGVADNIDMPYLGLEHAEVVGKYSKPSYEKILELKPQAVLCYVKSYSDEDFSATLEPLGIKVVKLDLFKPEAYDNEIIELSKAFGKEERAKEFVAWKNQKENLLAEKLQQVKPEDQVSAFAMYTSNFAKGNYKTFAQDTATHQGLTMAGGKNIAGHMEGYPQVSPEWILEEDPEVFILNASGDDVQMGYDADDLSWSKDMLASAKSDKVISQTKAGENDRVHLIYSKLLGGDKTYLGAFFLAKWFYPEIFADVNPDDVLEEYFSDWLNVPLKGIWSYEGN